MVLLTITPANLSIAASHPHHRETSPAAVLSKSTATRTNILLSTCSKSKPFHQTLKLFRLLPFRDTVTWNTILSACSREGRFQLALHLFLEMLSSAAQVPDSVTFRLALEASSWEKNTLFLLQIHAYILKIQGLYSADLITSTCLICVYREFGLIEDAHQVFETISERDVVASAAMMSAWNEVGEHDKAIKTFSNMVRVDNLVPNEFTFTCALHACSGMFSLFVGEQIHACAIKAGVKSQVVLGTSLVDMYAKCDCMDSAKLALSEISSPNASCWNALMSGDLSDEQVLDLFFQMRVSGVTPDHVTIATVLRVCKDAPLRLARQMHGLVAKLVGTEIDVFIGGALFERYVDWGCVCDAGQVFEEIHDKDIDAFNSAIRVYAQNGFSDKALCLFHEASQVGKVADESTFTSLMTGVEEINHGKQLHNLIVKFGFGQKKKIASSVVKMYSSFDCSEDSLRLFDQVDNPDLILCTSLISSFCQRGKHGMALKLYNRLLLEGVVVIPNDYLFSCLLHATANLSAAEEAKQIHAQVIKLNAEIGSDMFISTGLVDAYAKCGYINDARRLFDTIKHPDIAAWNAMITGLARHGLAETATEMFHRLMNMRKVQPDPLTYAAVLSACSHRGLAEEGYQYFRLIKEPTVDHYACLVNLFGRVGWLEEALTLVLKMPFEPNEIVWSSLLAASSFHGNTEIAEYSARHLFQICPKDPGTYVALSNVYARQGMWQYVRKVRKLMKDQGVSKDRGSSWLNINGRTHVFQVGRQMFTSKKLHEDW